MSAADRSGFRPPSALPPSRTDGTGPQPSNPSTPPSAWPSSGPALTGAGTPGQAQTKALRSTGGTPDGKSISSLQASVGTPSAPVVAELHRALVELVGLVPQDGKQASLKHQKQFEEKLQAFAALAATSRDAALHTLVKSFEMLAVHEDPRSVDWTSPHKGSVFFALAERVFLALDVGGDIANLQAALAAIPGGDVLAASPAKAALPEQMMRALTRAVGAPTPERPWSRGTVPKAHIDALLARVFAGPASKKTAEWLLGMTHGLLSGAARSTSNFSVYGVFDQLLPWARETLRTLSGEQIAGLAYGVLEGTTQWNSYERLMTELTAPKRAPSERLRESMGVSHSPYLPPTFLTSRP